MESNRVKKLVYDTSLVELSPGPVFKSCNNVVDGFGNNDCCPDATGNYNYTFTQQMIDTYWFNVKINDVSGNLCEDDVFPPGWDGHVDITLTPIGGSPLIPSIATNTSIDGQEFQIKISDWWPDMQPGTYTITIGSAFSQGMVTFKEEVLTLLSDSDVAGGLRVRELVTYDTDLTELRHKYFNYDNPEDNGYSSGRYYMEPSFAHVIATDKHINGGQGYYYVKMQFKSTPTFPLTDLQGYHLGYSRVEEYEDNGTTTIYKFKARAVEDKASTPLPYPLAPLPYNFDNGALISQDMGNRGMSEGTGDDVYVLSKSLSGVEQLFAVNANPSVRVQKEVSQSITMYMVNDFTHQSNGFYRLDSEIQVLDGVNTTSTYSYNLDYPHLNPIAVSTYNSQGEQSVTYTKHLAEMMDAGLGNPSVHADMESRNMIGIPLETSQSYEYELTDGTRTIYDLFGGIPYPEEILRYEATWENGSKVVNPDGNAGWVSQGVINSYYHGKPVSITMDGWQPESYTYDPVHFLPAGKTYGTFNWSYQYHPGTRLISRITDVDGQYTDYAYDGLGRLISTSDRLGNVTTSYDYNYPQGSIPAHVKTIINYTPVAGSSLSTTETTQYVDGIARPVQIIRKNHAEDLSDVGRFMSYDQYGRKITSSHPVKLNQFNGQYVHPVNIPALDEITFTYEDNPLNRIISELPPSWYETTTSYGTNIAGEVIDPVSGSAFPANTLYKTTMTDPEDHVSVTFTDMLGRKVSERRYSSTGSLLSDTRTIYDDKHRVIKILPDSTTTNQLEKIYEYRYDYADNILESKFPSRDKSQFLYDDRNLTTYSRDGFHPWIHTRYDIYGRPENSGYVNSAPINGNSVMAYTTQLNSLTYDEASGGPRSRGLLTSMWEKDIYDHTIQLNNGYVYDDYGRLITNSGNHVLNPASNQALQMNLTYDFADNILSESQSTTLSGTINTGITTSTYDHQGRLKEQFFSADGQQNQICELQYNAKDLITQRNIGKSQSYWLQSLDYDYLPNQYLAGINIHSTLPGGTVLGSCNLPSSVPQSPSINPDNNDLMVLKLGYHTAVRSVSGYAPIRNGNISQIEWTTRGRSKQLYSFTYDDLDRLTNANYFEGNNTSTALNQYHTSIGYRDALGNISTITRKGAIAAASCYGFQTIDNLTFQYNATDNRLVDVVDASGRKEGFEYYNHTASGADYQYDANGNITYDPSSEHSITYNHLNLPELIQDASGNRITNVYTASGTKIRSIYQRNGSILETRDYIVGMEYLNGEVESMSHGEGQVRFNRLASLYLSGTMIGDEEHFDGINIESVQGIASASDVVYEATIEVVMSAGFETSGSEFYAGVNPGLSVVGTSWEYHIRDHLGNTRVIFSDLDGDGTIELTGDPVTHEVIEEHQYYPFGMRHEGSWTSRNHPIKKNRYLYNGKEFIDNLGLEWYDYGARFYDPSVGRFTGVDAQADAPNLVGWSPYHYTYNNPIVYIDPNGENPIRAAMAAYKVGKRAYKIYKKTGKLDAKSLKRAGLDELVDIAGDLYIVFAGSSSGLDRLGAAVDLIAGTEFNSKGNKVVKKMVSRDRRKGVANAWKDEKALVEKTGEGTRRWTKAEKREFAEKGKVSGYEGHHINSVKDFPEEAASPSNVKFVKGRKEHLKEHGGNYRNKTEGQMIDRSGGG